MLATDSTFNRTIQGYHGQLLDMAVDLADRLMPAFKSTRTGIPFPRVKKIQFLVLEQVTKTIYLYRLIYVKEFHRQRQRKHVQPVQAV